MEHQSPSLAEAVDLFVMRNFVECFDTCCAVVNAAKCEPEYARNLEVIETSAALGIQALAETNMWNQAVKFITDIYGSIDLCPPHIIQVCILLHAHVKEYLPCQVLVHHWFENPANRKNKKSAQVIHTFASHILQPNGCLGDLTELVENCPSLSQVDKDALLQLQQSKQKFKETDASKHLTCHNYQTCTQSSLLKKNHGDKGESEEEETEDKDIEEEKKRLNNGNNYSVNDIMVYIYNQVTTFLNCRLRPWHKRLGIILMAVLAVFSLVQSQSGDPVSSLGRMVILWRIFISRLQQFYYN